MRTDNDRLIMKKFTISMFALLGFFSLLTAQVEVGDGSSNFTEFEPDGTMVCRDNSTVFGMP